MRDTTPQFIASYRGEFHYEVDGKRYGVRFFGHDDGHYNGDCYKTDIEPAIGTVMCEMGVEQFPPADIVAMLPGYVGARFVFTSLGKDSDGNELFSHVTEYAGAKPILIVRECNYTYAAEPYRVDREHSARVYAELERKYGTIKPLEPAIA